jgi:putative transcriptional regulator
MYKPMVNHHPDIRLLTEFSAGTLPLAQSACISAHLNYCDSCLHKSMQLQEVGAAMFEQASSASNSADERLLEGLLSRLDEAPPLHYPHAISDAEASAPPVLQRLMSGDYRDLGWERITSSVQISRLRTGDPNYEFALYRIAAGGKIPEHAHKGSELTLVLSGGFYDNAGEYHAGDFLLREQGDVHSPTVVGNQDCICLTVQEAPVQFTAWKYRWLNPFLRLKAG